MQTSDQGRTLIFEREGCRLEAYKDSVNVTTIGVGHTINVKLGDRCTPEQADAWLKRDLAVAEACINHAVKLPLEQFQFDALVSFVFNVGTRAFESSTLLRKINAGDLEGAAAEFDRWHIPAEIASRRTGEREQFRGEAFAARIDRAGALA